MIGPAQWRSDTDADGSAGLAGPALRLLILTDAGLHFVQLHLPLGPAVPVHTASNMRPVDGEEHGCARGEGGGDAEGEGTEEKETTPPSSHRISHVIPTASPLGPSGTRMVAKKATKSTVSTAPSTRVVVTAEMGPITTTNGKENLVLDSDTRNQDSDDAGTNTRGGMRGGVGTIAVVGSRMITEVRRRVHVCWN